MKRLILLCALCGTLAGSAVCAATPGYWFCYPLFLCLPGPAN